MSFDKISLPYNLYLSLDLNLLNFSLIQSVSIKWK